MQKILSIVPAVVLGVSLAAPAQASIDAHPAIVAFVPCASEVSHAGVVMNAPSCPWPARQRETRSLVGGLLVERRMKLWYYEDPSITDPADPAAGFYASKWGHWRLTVR